MQPKAPKIVCRIANKICYDTAELALMAVDAQKDIVELFVYYCRDCKSWHVTRQSKSRGVGLRQYLAKVRAKMNKQTPRKPDDSDG